MRTFIILGIFFILSFKILASTLVAVNICEKPDNSQRFAEIPCSFATIQDPPECNATIRKLNPISELYSTCVLNETDLLGLVDLVTDAIGNATIPSIGNPSFLASECQPDCYLGRKNPQRLREKNVLQEGPCEYLLNTLKGLLTAITQSIIPLVSMSYAVRSEAEYCAYVAQIEQRRKELRNHICSLELSSSQNLTGLYNKLMEQERCFLKTWECSMGTIRDLESSLQNQKLLGFIALLQAGRIGELYLDLYDDYDNKFVGDIITGAYNTATMEYIIQFVELSTATNLAPNRFVVYNSTLHAIIKATQTSSNVVIQLKYLVDSEPFQNMTGMAELKERVDKYTSRLLDGLKPDIQGNNFRSIIEFGSPPVNNSAGRSFRHILPELLNKTFENNEKNVGTLLQFVNAFRWNTQKSLGLTELEKLFSKTEHKIQLALHLENTMNGDLDGPDLELESVKQSLNKLKEKFSDVVRKVVWGKECSISTNGSFLSTSSFSDGEDFIQNPTGSTNTREEKWEFEPVYSDRRKEYFFRIKSSTNGEYLGADFFWETSYNGQGSTATSDLEPCGDERFYGWKFTGGEAPDQIQLYHLGRMLYLQFNKLVVSNPSGIKLTCNVPN